MAFDGITIAALTKELKNNITNGRISKISQPENDELLFTIKSGSVGQIRLLISASASLPLVYLTDTNKQSPITAPNFCMLLRKHISNGRIISVTQPSLERIINIEIEHLDEMGDLKCKTLVIELMGKHSNIIFLNSEGIIIDAIKHIPSSVSSLREVLPGRKYFIPETIEKKNPLVEVESDFIDTIRGSHQPVFKALYSNYTGFSPVFANELCFVSKVEPDCPANELDTIDLSRIFKSFSKYTGLINSGNFSPTLFIENNSPCEFSALDFQCFNDNQKITYPSISSLIKDYYAKKELVTRIRQKSVDLRKIVDTILERDIKKYDLQLKQMKDTEKKDTYRIYGELLNTYGYNAEPNSKSINVLNYYTNEEITIPLAPTLNAIDNAKKYFEKYNKLKRTYEALTSLTVEVKAEIDHLESLENSLNIAVSEDDLNAIKEEMILSGYIKKKAGSKALKTKSKPFHYVTKEGFHIYVGKNNLQNEEITFKVANGNDWWFHAKKIPGSHVIVKTEGKDIPDSVFEDAARLAAHYSKARGAEKVEVDYVKRKEIKHPNGAKPGFVVYYTNFSMLIDTDIDYLKEES